MTYDVNSLIFVWHRCVYVQQIRASIVVVFDCYDNILHTIVMRMRELYEVRMMKAVANSTAIVCNTIWNFKFTPQNMAMNYTLFIGNFLIAVKLNASISIQCRVSFHKDGAHIKLAALITFPTIKRQNSYECV